MNTGITFTMKCVLSLLLLMSNYIQAQYLGGSGKGDHQSEASYLALNGSTKGYWAYFGGSGKGDHKWDIQLQNLDGTSNSYLAYFGGDGSGDHQGGVDFLALNGSTKNYMAYFGGSGKGDDQLAIQLQNLDGTSNSYLAYFGGDGRGDHQGGVDFLALDGSTKNYMAYFGGSGRGDIVWNIVETTLSGFGTIWDGLVWSNGAPTPVISAYIASTVPPGDFNCGILTINDGVALTLGGGDTATISNGVITNNGNGLAGTGTLLINSTGSTELMGDTLTFEGVVAVSNGSTLQTNDLLVLSASSPTSFGTLVGEGSVSGNVTVQTWLDLAGGTTDGRYYHLGSPVTTAPINDFSEAGSTIVSANTAQGSIWEWDAANAAWTAAENENVNSTATNGKGYAVFAGSAYGANFLRDDAGTIDMTGAVANTDVTVPMAYNNGQSAVSTVGFAGGSDTSATQGWNLVANPYPAVYDWAGPISLPAGVSSAIYTWNGAGYASYSSGIGTNGGSQYIAPFQAFWVQLDNSAPVSNFTFERAFRASSAVGGELMKTSAVDGIRLIVSGADTTKTDETFVGFDANATSNYDGNLDARKLLNSAGVPNIYSKLGADWYSINRVPYTGPYAFPVGVLFEGHGEQMTISADFSELSAYSTAYLEDRATGITHDLSNGEYVYTQDTAFQSERFLLKFSGIGVEEEEGAALVSYAWSDGNDLVIETPTEYGASNEDFVIEVYNTLGQRLVYETGKGSIRKNLIMGTYMVRIHSVDSDYQEVIKVVHVVN